MINSLNTGNKIMRCRDRIARRDSRPCYRASLRRILDHLFTFAARRPSTMTACGPAAKPNRRSRHRRSSQTVNQATQRAIRRRYRNVIDGVTRISAIAISTRVSLRLAEPASVSTLPARQRLPVPFNRVVTGDHQRLRRSVSSGQQAAATGVGCVWPRGVVQQFRCGQLWSSSEQF